MIASNELRIGNWIHDIFQEDKPSVDFKVYALHKTKCFYGATSGIYHTTYERLRPIPLTPEWLERAGFEKIAGCYSIKIWDRGTLYVIIDDANVRFEIGNSAEGIVACKGDLTSVHSLQNLYWSLTGKELTFKP